MERSRGGIAAMRHPQSRGSQRNMSSSTSDSDLDASVEHDSPVGHSYEARRRLWRSFGSKASQGDAGSDTESARIEKLGSSRTSTGTMKYESSKDKCGPPGNGHVKPFFSSTGSCKMGGRSREVSTSSYHADDNSDREVVISGRNRAKTPNADCEKPDRFSEKVEKVCKKYGISQESIEDILSGKHSAERNQNRDEYSNNSECSSDGFREEMLIYLLNERMKLKAKLRAQRGKPHRPTYAERQNAKRDPNGVYFKELNEVTHDEMKQISQMWDRPGMNDSNTNETVYHPVRSVPYCSSSESSPMSYLNKEVLNTDVHGNVPGRRSQHGPADLMISHEASSLQDEIDELMNSLENSGAINAQLPQYCDNGHQSNVQAYKKQGSTRMQKVVEDDVSDVEISGLVKPVKVPLRPAKPDRFDAQVLTDETARERELQMYERLDRDINRRKSESEGSHQTDNTRITKDGIAWDITESYLKEEERRMLQEKKRAELLLQLKKGPSVKSDTLQDHYNRWLQRKSGSYKGDRCQTKQVGETTEKIEQANCEQSPSRVAPRGGAKSVTCGRNIFRRNKGNKMNNGGLMCTLGCGSSQLSSRSDAVDDTSSDPRDDVKPDLAGSAQHNRDVYIKGSWDPRTGAVKISNDLDSSYSVNKNQMLDDYVNFLKQSPGNWNQEQDSANSLTVEQEVDDATPLRIDERDLERQESNDGMPEPEKFYNRVSRGDMESLASTPRSSDHESLSSSDSARRMYERDEFYPSTNAMPMQSPSANDGINPQPFAMGFRDPYMPHFRMGGGFYSPTYANMPLVQGGAVEQGKGSGAEHHHHYHYRCRESHRKCGHRRRHSCRHGHKHACSKKKHSSKKAVESNVVLSQDGVTDELRAEGEPKPLVTMADRCVVQKQVEDESQDGDPSSPSFGVKDKVLGQGGQLLSGDLTPVTMHDIITSTGQARGTDFVKVVTYQTSVDESDGETDAQLEEDQMVDQSCMKKYFMCCPGKSERDVKYEPLRGASLTPTTYQGTPSSRANSNVGVVTSDPSKKVPRGPRRYAEDRTQSPSGSNTPVSSANSSPTSGYPHVFRRRANSRNEGSVTCASPFSKLGQLESCKQMQDASCKKVCPYEHDSGAESGEQFTFRSTSGESPKRDASPPMYKTRLIYVGNN